MTVMALINVKNASFSMPINIGVGILFRNLQKDLYNEHIKNGGEKASYSLPIIIGVLFIALMIALSIYSEAVPKNSVAYGKNNVYYTNAVSESEAKKLGNYLKSQKMFTDNSEFDIKIDKEKNTYVYSIIVKDSTYTNNQEFINSMKEISKAISKDVFNNSPVRIDICNDQFKVLKSIN